MKGSGALLRHWRQIVRRHGAEQAVVEAATGAAITFADLARRAAAWRDTHIGDRAGVRGRVAVFGVPNGIGWLEIFLGLLEAGIVAVPLDPGEPAAAQAETARRLGASFLWSGESLVSLPGRRSYAG